MNHPLRPDWTLRKAIEDQVRKEDMLRWAMTPTPEHQVVPPLPKQTWKRAPLKAFLSKIIP